jgi:hypothetical protein
MIETDIVLGTIALTDRQSHIAVLFCGARHKRERSAFCAVSRQGARAQRNFRLSRSLPRSRQCRVNRI